MTACGATSRPTELATLTYSAAFGRQVKRLRKKYPRIRDDLQPLIDDLQAGHTPGDQITGARYTVYKVRLPTPMPAVAKAAAIESSTGYRPPTHGCY